MPALPPRSLATSSSLEPIYEAVTLQWHCSSKPRTTDGSAYPSQTSRLSVGVFLAQEPRKRTDAANSTIRNRRLINQSPHSLICTRTDSPLKRWRSVNPQHPSFAAARVEPAMRRGALKIETVTSLKSIFDFRH